MDQSSKWCGKPSIPRQTMPSMFQILAWNQNCSQKVIPDQKKKQNINKHQTLPSNYTIQQKQKQLFQITKKKKTYSIIKQGLYEQSQINLKKTKSEPKIQKKKQIKQKLTRKQQSLLNPINPRDKQKIQQISKNLKKFGYISRDLPNSAFTTYYGKPTWQAYGRGNSKPAVKSHNVMPHRGLNRPKTAQSYISALIKGKDIQVSNSLPRKSIYNQQKSQKQNQKNEQQVINLPLKVPDLINSLRFAIKNNQSTKKQYQKIPSHIVNVKKQQKQKNIKKTKKQDSKLAQDINDLKFMTNRNDLLRLMQQQKKKKSRLAWKVTQCYPNNHQQMQIAGNHSNIGPSVAELIKMQQNS